MPLYDAIFKRKSCRKYMETPLPSETLHAIEAAIASFAPLYQNMPLQYRFTTETKGVFKVQAPHYLIVSGAGATGEEEQAGFLYEQLVLWLDTQGIGSVWLGKAKDANLTTKNDIIALAFGAPAEPLHRTMDDFRRKPIGEITNAPKDPIMRAVHLAPSGMNLQPWYLEKEDAATALYLQKIKAPLSLLYKKTAVDMGIALSHYALACAHHEKPFSFTRVQNEPAKTKKGYTLFGKIT
ncbi:MAG: nitroreductase family protein [Christensenellaceae bacterium]|jgi:hypothetical protein